MSTRAALKSGTSPFAHLARPPKAADGDDDTKKKDDAAKKAKADEDGDDDSKKDDKKKDDAKKAKKAKADDGAGKDADDEDSADEDGDDDSKKDDKKKDDAKKAKKAKADDGDDSDDMEDEEQDKDARVARARERSRIRAILVSEPGKANPVAAAHLATGTSMPRGQAIEMLAAMQAGQVGASAAAEPRRDNLRDRMAEVPNASVGAEDQRPAPNLAAQIIAAGKKRRGEA